MCYTYSIICWSNPKRFFSILIVFGKCFCFENFQNFQKLCNSVLVTRSHRSIQSQDPSCEKDIEKFQIFWVFSIFTTHFGDWFVSGSSNHEFTQNASRLPLRLTCKWTFQSSSREKHLDKFFKICHTGFWQLDLALAHDSFQSQKTHILHK